MKWYIIDDHAAFRSAARRLLETGAHAVVGESDGSGDITSLVAGVVKSGAEAALIDVNLETTDGFDVEDALTRVAPGLSCVMISSRPLSSYAVRLAASDAVGFIAKAELTVSALEGLLPATNERRLRVFVADDSDLFRHLLVQALRGASLDVVGEASDVDGVMAHFEHTSSTDVVILDVRMPPTHTNEGIRAAAEIRRSFPHTGVVLLSQYVETSTAAELLESCETSIGYLLKDRVTDIDELVTKIRRVHEGESVIDPTVVARLLSKSRRSNPLDRLTPAQGHVLKLVAEGYSNKAIGERLFISERTVESHVSVVFDVLGLERTPSVHRRVLAAIMLLRNTE